MTPTGQSSTARRHEPAELAARWMQWAAASSAVSNPLLDETGADAGRKQPQDVWFLAGTMGGDSAHRQFAVPTGRPLFGPAFCMWGPEPITASDIASAVGTVRVDGHEVETVRAVAGPVRVRGGALNPVTRVPWLPTTMYLAGIWAGVAPLAVGTHFVEVRGGDGHGFETAVDAEIQVA
ncbi:hypothetical protein [Oerskovia jenensis]|uniref:hypothetical protein n=1 Tax=Oerskovia jenensis TaxID=162169 RepID=UPI0036DC1208